MGALARIDRTSPFRGGWRAGRARTGPDKIVIDRLRSIVQAFLLERQGAGRGLAKTSPRRVVRVAADGSGSTVAYSEQCHIAASFLVLTVGSGDW